MENHLDFSSAFSALYFFMTEDQSWFNLRAVSGAHTLKQCVSPGNWMQIWPVMYTLLSWNSESMEIIRYMLSLGREQFKSHICFNPQ